MKLICIYLPCARDTEDGGRRRGFGCSPAECKVGEVFGRSMERLASAWEHWGRGLESYAWAPSERAMKGRKDQSLSAAGSVPSSTPNQLSISGPLTIVSSLLSCHLEGKYLAWWKPTTQTMGAKLLLLLGAIV